MKILNKISELNNRTVLAIGTFDGLHLGHWDVINTAVAEAKNLGLPSAVLTFANHPLSYINPKLQPKELITLAEKHRLLASAGVDILVEIPFDKNVAEISAKDFVDMVSHHKIVVGEDFHFGKDKQGDAHAFSDCIIKPLLKMDGEVISSTRIRRVVQAGDLTLAARLLGRPYVISGVVQHGDERGRLLGFPTANLDVKNLVVPPLGVYGGKVLINPFAALRPSSPKEGTQFHAMANLGCNPTFGVTEPRLEVYLFDFDGNLYGQTISVELGAKLREQKQFANVVELKAQLAQDKINACLS